MQVFEKNDGQQKVLDHKSGPLLVVAGAGTGKTRTITEKIHLLLDSGIEPSQILAVTFTEKAALEMVERVQENTPGLFLDLPIHTFNGYGDSILREFGIHIGIPRTFQIMSPQAALVFFRERIEDFELDYFLPLTNLPDALIEDLLRHFSKLKQNLIRPNDYKKYVDNLPSETKEDALAKQQYSELADAYTKYTELCRKENVIDYDDQIYLAIDLLETRPNVQARLRERYHTVFVDEFQDTNPMQSKLIDLITPESKNLIVVGDDDQAIYGFRGATISNILNFEKRYPETDKAALIINYRSHQSILDAAHNLIQKNNPHRLESSLGINKHLVSKVEGNDPQVHRFVDKTAELNWLAQHLLDKYQKNPSSLESTAILTRSNNVAFDIHQVLKINNIPHRVVGLNPDLYQTPIIRCILELIRTINEPGNNASLHNSLIGDFFLIENQLVAPIAKKARYEHEELEVMLANKKDFSEAIRLIGDLRKMSATASAGQVIWRAITESGLKDRLLELAKTDDSAAMSLGHISQLFENIKTFENVAMQPTLIQYQLALPSLMAAGDTTDDTLGLTEKELVITTVHKAKGLEWDNVYLPMLTEQKFPMWKQAEGLSPPEELVLESRSPADEHYSEERRVMYVAITRARKNLVLSFSDGPRKPSRFINEMFGEGFAEALNHTEIVKGVATLTFENDEVVAPAIPTSIFDGKLVKLDVSKAQTLLNCPLNFYYKYILEVPSEPSASTEYGTRMHSFIQEINEARHSNTPLRPLPEMSEDLEKGWSKYGYASKTQQLNALERAKRTLSSYYQSALQENPPTAIEQPFAVEIATDIFLTGRIDAVYDYDGVEIRDFKTGISVKSPEDAKKKAQESRQLELYALAWREMSGQAPKKLTLHFVDTGFIGVANKRESTFDSRRQQIIDAVENLKNKKFPPGSSHRYCIHPDLGD